MWAEINGERKKVACGPCIRGHRSSKCDHRDRVLVEVRKPGRPLSSCPHPSGSCSCERVVINYTIPKTSECACPSEKTQPVASASGTSSRVQKSRNKKSTSTFNSASLEKAIKANQDAETDSSSLLTRTPTNPSFPSSEKTASDGVSPPSSASSTPRILPSPSRKQSVSSDIPISDASIASSSSRPPNATPQEVSSCCRPKSARPGAEPAQQQSGSCCGNKGKEQPKPVQPKKSCCSGSSQANPVNMMAQMSGTPNIAPTFEHLSQQQQQGQCPNQPYGMVNSSFNFNVPGNMGIPVPFGFNTPIHNHMASGCSQSGPMPIGPALNGNSTEHNCHCGETCSCFGCAAHPNNATMMEYIRLMHQYMSTGGFGPFSPPTYDLPSYPHHPGYGAEATHSIAFQPSTPTAQFPPLGPGQMVFPPHVNAMMSIANTPVNSSGPWQPNSLHAPVPPPSTADTQFFQPPQGVSSGLKTEEAAPSPIIADSPSEGKDEDTPTLSPSSYFWNELVLPGCNDATGACRCGDGCECVGCLTHGGHNGVALETTPTIADNNFSDMLSGIASPEMDQVRTNL